MSFEVTLTSQEGLTSQTLERGEPPPPRAPPAGGGQVTGWMAPPVETLELEQEAHQQTDSSHPHSGGTCPGKAWAVFAQQRLQR